MENKIKIDCVVGIENEDGGSKVKVYTPPVSVVRSLRTSAL